jgi:hypothetical protein
MRPFSSYEGRGKDGSKGPIRKGSGPEFDNCRMSWNRSSNSGPDPFLVPLDGPCSPSNAIKKMRHGFLIFVPAMVDEVIARRIETTLRYLGDVDIVTDRKASMVYVTSRYGVISRQQVAIALRNTGFEFRFIEPLSDLSIKLSPDISLTEVGRLATAIDRLHKVLFGQAPVLRKLRAGEEETRTISSVV